MIDDPWARKRTFHSCLKLKIRCQVCIANIYKHWKDCKLDNTDKIYLLPKSCDVCGRGGKIDLIDIKLIKIFGKEFEKKPILGRLFRWFLKE